MSWKQRGMGYECIFGLGVGIFLSPFYHDMTSLLSPLFQNDFFTHVPIFLPLGQNSNKKNDIVLFAI